MSTATVAHSGMSGGRSARAPRGGLWRDEVLDRAGRLETDLVRLHKDTEPTVRLAHRHLAAARALTDRSLSPIEWWSGSRVEACWRELRMAEEAVLDVGTELEVRARVTDVRTHAEFYLGGGDDRTKNLVALLETRPQLPLRELLPAARIALAASHENSDRQHRERRSFMNTLRVTVAVLVVLAALLVIAATVWSWDLLPTLGPEVQPAPIVIAMLFGAIGALFSAVPSLAQMPGKAEPFSPVRTQAALKVVVGAWSAVIGLMAVSASLTSTAVPGVTGSAANASTSVSEALATTNVQTLAGFALVAALFGASQEAITRFADHKAAGLSGGDTTASTTTS
jgi:hypothetical protein